MTSDKRDFTNFKEFPHDEDGPLHVHAFPPLYNIDANNNLRKWTVFVRLIKTPRTFISDNDWNLMAETHVELNDKYYEVGAKIMPSILAQVWAETGIVQNLTNPADTGTKYKMMRTSPTYINEVANLGHANERNVFQQALIMARSDYEKKCSLGYSTNPTRETPKDKMYFPMLAEKLDDVEMNYPAYIQPKLDGVRCIIYLDKRSGNVMAYSRTKKPFVSIDYIKEALKRHLYDLYDDAANESIYLDGELYRHGASLQEISGVSRNAANAANDARNSYYIYDCFYPSEMFAGFAHRNKQLQQLFGAMTEQEQTYVKYVPTFKVASYDDAFKLYNKFRAEKYEGAMLRSINGEYKGSLHGKQPRSRDLVKLKPIHNAEYKCVGFTEGRGKDKGKVIWVCETADGVQFNVTPKSITYDERARLYKECVAKFDELYSGVMLTVEYQDLSKNRVPLRAKSLGFRSVE